MTDIQQKTVSRDKKIIQTSIIGIIANVFLAVFKAVIGTISVRSRKNGDEGATAIDEFVTRITEEIENKSR